MNGWFSTLVLDYHYSFPLSAAWHVIFLSNKNTVMKQDKTSIKKERNLHRNESLDTNNNKNLPDKPLVKRRGKLVRDDGFEHRSSEELK